MSNFGYVSKSADGYNLSIPPTTDEIEAVQNRMSSYTDPNYPRPDRLERLGVSLERFSADLSDHPKGYVREADIVRELANLAFNSAEDLRQTI